MVIYFLSLGDDCKDFEVLEICNRFTLEDLIDRQSNRFDLFEERFHIDFERGHGVMKAKKTDNFVSRAMKGAAKLLETVR